MNVIIGNADIVDAFPGHNQELISITKPDGGTTNIALIDDNGEQVANMLVTNPAIQYQLARSQTGMQATGRKTNAIRLCQVPKPNDYAATKLSYCRILVTEGILRQRFELPV
jgi:hypothetical protein